MNVLQVAIPIVAVLVAAFISFLYGRRSHRREQQLDAYASLVSAFYAAASSGAELLTVHSTTGFPHKLNADIDVAFRRELTEAHRDAFLAASDRRQDFDVARFRALLVCGARVRSSVDELQEFLDRALYDGDPWTKNGYPPARLNPVDIAPDSIKVAEPFIAIATEELWGRPPRRRRSRT